MIRGVFLGAVFVFAFSTVIGLSFLLAGRVARDDPRLRKRFGSLVTGEGRSVQAQQEGAILREEFLVRRQGRIRKALRLCFPGLGDLALWLELAGMAMGPVRFAQIWILATVAGGLLGFAFSLGLGGLVAGLLLGWTVPPGFLWQMRRRREKAFEKQFPEVLRHLSTTIRAGHGLLSSIRALAEEFAPPASVEFGKIAEETALGLGIEDALRNMLERMDSPDLRFFASSIIIHRETGGNLAVILDQIESLLRERLKLRGEVKALTTPGRFTGYILGFLPAAIVIILVMVNPAYMAPLWKTQYGQMVMTGGFLLQGLGYLVIRRIVQIEL